MRKLAACKQLPAVAGGLPGGFLEGFGAPVGEFGGLES